MPSLVKQSANKACSLRRHTSDTRDNPGTVRGVCDGFHRVIVAAEVRKESPAILGASADIPEFYFLVVDGSCMVIVVAQVLDNACEDAGADHSGNAYHGKRHSPEAAGALVSPHKSECGQRCSMLRRLPL